MIAIMVTASDIRDGARCSAERCPVALALRRKFPDVADEVTVGFTYAGVGDRYLCLSDDAILWINAYDRGREVAPVVLEAWWRDDGSVA